MSAERLGPFFLRQPPGVFPLGEDALRLAAFATVRRSWKVCDLGTGSGCLLLPGHRIGSVWCGAGSHGRPGRPG